MLRKQFSRSTSEAIDQSPIIGVRAGARSRHRFTGVWVVVIGGRVFARSWTRKPDGWFRTFLEDPLGHIQLGARRIPIRTRRTRGRRLCEAIEREYARKYSTPASQKYVRGFRNARRREATLEFIPR